MRKITLIFILVLILIVGFSVFYKSKFENKNPQKNIPNVTPTPQQIHKECFQFPIEKKEVSCEDAINIAFQKYPGQYISVENTIRYYEAETSRKRETKKAKVWIVNVKPYDQSIFPPTPKPEKNVKFLATDTIGVVIDRITKEILFWEPVYRK